MPLNTYLIEVSVKLFFLETYLVISDYSYGLFFNFPTDIWNMFGKITICSLYTSVKATQPFYNCFMYILEQTLIHEPANVTMGD